MVNFPWRRKHINTHSERLGNGMLLVRVDMPGARTASLHLAFPAGARHERSNEEGVAHFLEHLVFRGGEEFGVGQEIRWKAEELGAKLNAYTSHDFVEFEITGQHTSLGEMAALLTDFVLHPRLRASDVDLERDVVLQEIARNQDDPGERCYSLLSRAIHGDHALGHDALGTSESVAGLTRGDAERFRGRQWVSCGAVAVVAGRVSNSNYRMLGRLLEAAPRNKSTSETTLITPEESSVPSPAPAFTRRVVVEETDSEQSHLKLYWPMKDWPLQDPVLKRSALGELGLHDPGTQAAYCVYLRILGDMGSGSRLAEEVRSRRGFAYYIYAGAYVHSDTLGVYVGAGLGADKCWEAYGLINDIVAGLAETGPTQGEVRRVKAGCVGEYARTLENASSVAGIVVNDYFMTGGAVVSPEAFMRALEAVTLSDVAAVAAAVRGLPAVACVGPHKESDFLNTGGGVNAGGDENHSDKDNGGGEK